LAEMSLHDLGSVKGDSMLIRSVKTFIEGSLSAKTNSCKSISGKCKRPN
jgi:hypothetical protein